MKTSKGALPCDDAAVLCLNAGETAVHRRIKIYCHETGGF